MNYYTFILKCSDDKYYTGVTNDLERRIWEHQNGVDPNYTYSRKPIKLVYSEFFPEIVNAIMRKKQIKGWSRKKKEALINERLNKLPEPSKSKTKHPSTGSG